MMKRLISAICVHQQCILNSRLMMHTFGDATTCMASPSPALQLSTLPMTPHCSSPCLNTCICCNGDALDSEHISCLLHTAIQFR